MMNKTKTPIDLNDKINKEDEIGTLIVVLLKARNLNDKHSFRKSDVFAQATLNGIQKRTHVDIKGGQRPEWDGEVRFIIVKHKAEKYRKLEVACYSQEPRSEDLMGQGFIDISETLRTGEFDDWVQLEVDGVKRGELYLEMTYYANAPAPVGPLVPNKQLSAVLAQNNLSRRPSKLSPADRLSRPQQTGLAAAQYAQQAHSKLSSRPHEQYHPAQSSNSQAYDVKPNAVPASLLPTHAASVGSSPKARHDALPAKDPYTSYPGHRRQESEGYPQQPQGAAPLPNILRPGPNGSTTPSTAAGSRPVAQGHIRHPSQDIYNNHGRNETSAPNPYISGNNSAKQNPYIGGNTTPPKNHTSSYAGASAIPENSANPYVAGSVSAPGNPTNPYTGGNTLTAHSGLGRGRGQSVAPPQQGPSYTGYGSPPPNGPPLLWQQSSSVPSNGSFSFPTPMIVSPTQERPTHQSFASYSDNSAAYGGRSGPQYHQHHPPVHRASSSRDEQLDPYLQARYQSPLPLPPGTSPSGAPTRPAPATPTVHAPAPAPAPNAARSPTPPSKSDNTAPDRSRLEALRKAEEESSRRREQEIKDLELALQLDRELNLAEERSTANASDVAMPGRWQ